MNCPACGQVTEPGHRFCFACGDPLPVEQGVLEKKKASERVAGAIVAYKRHGAPLVEAARESGLKGLLSASLSRVIAAAAEENSDLLAHASAEGTVTIGFSDIEGSTAANERLGDKAWLEVLRGHNEIIREQLKAHGGFEVKSLGDGFMVAFASTRAAVHWALGVQRAFHERGEGQPEPIAVRIGIHTGEAIREGGDLLGADVALAARIAASARGGQILVSDVVKERIDDTGEFEFGKTRKKRGLKGISGPQVLHEVLWR